MNQKKSEKEFLRLLKKIKADYKGALVGYDYYSTNYKISDLEFWEFLQGGRNYTGPTFDYVSKSEHRLMTVYRKEFLAWWRIQR